MTDNFFDIGGGTNAPSAPLKDLNDHIIGTVVETYKRDFTPYAEDKPQVITDQATGQPRVRQQMVVILQTAHRNWEKVSKVPLVDPGEPSKGYKPAAEDDGKRAVYIPEMVKGAGHNGFIFAVAQAVREAKTGGLPEGATFKAAIIDLKDVGKGNPLKVYKVIVEPPAAGAELFGAVPPAQQAAPAPAAPQAPPAQPAAPAAPAAPQAADPFAQAAPAAQPPAPAAPAQVDPWSGAPVASQPPF